MYCQNKIFFILTYPESYIPYLELSTNNPGTKFSNVYYEKKQYNNEKYIISVNSFNIIEDKLVKDNETDKYVLNIILKQKKYLIPNLIYNGKIEFNEIRNHFMYNFKFENLNLYLTESRAPTNNLILSKIEKIKIFSKTLQILGSDPGDSLSNDFSEDSIDSIIKEKTFDIECYLELLKYCHTTKKIINLLKYFNLKNCEISKKLKIEEYSPILDKIDSNPEIYTKYLNEADEIIYCKHKFYDLLLYFRMNYEKGKLKILLSKKELCQYYAEKINFNEKLNPLVALAEKDFINKIMEQKKLSFEIIKEIIFSSNSFEKNISFIDNNYDKIKEICKKEECHRMVRGNSQTNILSQDKAKNIFQSPTDKLRKIIEDIIKELGKRKYLFILFDEKFWNNYLNEKIKIFLIDESIIICQKFDKKFEAFKQEENKMVSKLNNQDLLVFLENDLRNYDNRKYEIYYCTLNYLFLNNSFENERKKNITEYFKTYKPLSLLDKININDLDEEFFKKWDTIKNGIFKLKNKRYILNSKDIISKIKDMDDFENVLKLFFTKGVYNDDINYYEKDSIMLLSEAFIILITTNKTYNNIPQNASFVINLLIKINKNKEKKNYDLDIRKGFNLLMKQIEENINYYPLIYIESIEDKISDKKICNEMLICLSSNYRISNEIINHIADYIFKNKEIQL